MIPITQLVDALDTPEQQQEAAARIFRQYENRMFSVAYDVVKNRQTAEDVVMETTEKILRHIDDFMDLPDEKLKLKIIVCTRNTAIDVLRYDKKQKTAHLDPETLEWLAQMDDEEKAGLDALAEEDGNFLREDEEELLTAYLQKLPEPYRDVFYLKYICDMRYDEIAETLEIPRNTVATRLNRGKQILRKMMEKEGRI